MVLSVPCGAGEFLLGLKATGVASIGIDADSARVSSCLEVGLRVWKGSWHAIAARTSMGLRVDVVYRVLVQNPTLYEIEDQRVRQIHFVSVADHRHLGLVGLVHD